MNVSDPLDKGRSLPRPLEVEGRGRRGFETRGSRGSEEMTSSKLLFGQPILRTFPGIPVRTVREARGMAQIIYLLEHIPRNELHSSPRLQGSHGERIEGKKNLTEGTSMLASCYKHLHPHARMTCSGEAVLREVLRKRLFCHRAGRSARSLIACHRLQHVGHGGRH